ncbi:MAG: OB-fold nucleic acid binding domain-containing protein [Candidatus Nanopelagicales bacterium]|nr:OB-fold nucleic acid binding domain-containing protein [Candidatus Nanopelagicales bacterium]MCU0296609.1 OB-fold nucleic acid binding domain-containing protein [Candidatus Nanopelagicales bacterium]MCU0297600.1 OB-fold nucleic acid binding domain-containing protein [Candidatus Nanopelagicales bacterium]
MSPEKSWSARTSTGQKCQHVMICDAGIGDVVEVSGRVHSVTLHPSGGVESFEADVADDTGIVHLVWLGRRRLTGIVPSRRISARGRVAERDGRKVIFNPEYELTIPSAG